MKAKCAFCGNDYEHPEPVEEVEKELYTIYTFQINVETLEIEVDEMETDEPYGMFRVETDYETATFNDWDENLVYCESLVSAARAKEIVMKKCRELKSRFLAAETVLMSKYT